jgi:hypothetical protein
VRRFVRTVTKDKLSDFIKFQQAFVASGDLPEATLNMFIARTEELDCMNAVLVPGELAVNGRDIIKHLKLKPSPVIGEILAGLVEKVLDNPELNNTDSLLKLAKTLKK